MNEQIKTSERAQEYYNEQMKQFEFEVNGEVGTKIVSYLHTHPFIDEGALQGIIIKEICREAARLSENFAEAL